MGFFSVKKLRTVEIIPGFTRRSVYLDELMVTFFEFEAGVKVNEHTHPHEQINYILSGALEFGLDGVSRIIRAGDGVTVPSNTPHWARAIEPTKMLDAWHPVRDDYR